MIIKTPFLSGISPLCPRLVESDFNYETFNKSNIYKTTKKILLQEIQFYEPTPSVTLTEER